MKKPKPKARKSMYNYHECRDFIEAKYKVDTHMTIWHHLCDAGAVVNGGELHFDPKQILHEEQLAKDDGTLKSFYNDYASKTMCDHCRLWVKEFPDAGDEPFWCEW